jgi:hypothetical protein
MSSETTSETLSENATLEPRREPAFEPAFEQRLIDALNDDTISAGDLRASVKETELAITTADNDAEIAKEMALDPLQSPDAAKARQVMEDAKFKADRLCNLHPRLRERLIEVGNSEDYNDWRDQFDPLVPQVEDAAAKLEEIYQKFTDELIPLLEEIGAIDAEVAAVLSKKPWHARDATNDGCYLRSVELTARGIEGFGIYDHKITEIKLPDWNDPTKWAWPPPPSPINYAALVQQPRHPGADWWK